MKKLDLIGIIFLMVMGSCSPKITSNVTSQNEVELSDDDIIHIYELNDQIPSNAKLLGNIKIGDSGLSVDCKYDRVIQEAKNEAKKANANIVKITVLKRPDLLSTCYRIEAELYFVENIPESRSFPARALPEESDFSLIQFYRPNNYFGSLIKFKIIDAKGNQIVALKNDSKFTFKTISYGEQVFWAPKIGEQSITINVEKGMEYYVSCEMVQTFSGSDKTMQLVRSEKGELEMNSTKRTQ